MRGEVAKSLLWPASVCLLGSAAFLRVHVGGWCSAGLSGSAQCATVRAGGESPLPGSADLSMPQD